MNQDKKYLLRNIRPADQFCTLCSNELKRGQFQSIEVCSRPWQLHFTRVHFLHQNFSFYLTEKLRIVNIHQCVCLSQPSYSAKYQVNDLIKVARFDFIHSVFTNNKKLITKYIHAHTVATFFALVHSIMHSIFYYMPLPASINSSSITINSKRISA